MTIIVIDDKPVKMTRVGQGTFSRVYKGDDGRIYHFVPDNANTDRIDMSKEAVALFAMGEHVPEIRDHDQVYFPRIGWAFCYSMPLYYPLSGEARGMAQQLRKLWRAYNRSNRHKRFQTK